MRGMNRAVILLLSVFCLCCIASGSLVLIGTNMNRTFDHIEAKFAVPIRASGEMGVLFMADPLDACNDLNNKVEIRSNGTSPFVLIIRGGCSFKEKVIKAQTAGFKAAIVYDNEDSGVLLAMTGNSIGIKIHAVFVSKTSGESLTALPISSQVWLIPSFENSAWPIIAITSISMLVVSAAMAACFFVHRHRRGRHEFYSLSRRLLKARFIFTSVQEDNSTGTSCVICLNDYNIGDELRVLPCHHKFHSSCIDEWLISKKPICPVCNQDVGILRRVEPPSSMAEPSALESLPSSDLFSRPHVDTSYIQNSFRPSNVHLLPTFGKYSHHCRLDLGSSEIHRRLCDIVHVDDNIQRICDSGHVDVRPSDDNILRSTRSSSGRRATRLSSENNNIVDMSHP